MKWINVLDARPIRGGVDMIKWYVHTESEAFEGYDNGYTLTTNPDIAGWSTDMGYPGYALPLEIAQWICDVLNASTEPPPMIREEFGWEKI